MQQEVKSIIGIQCVFLSHSSGPRDAAQLNPQHYMDTKDGNGLSLRWSEAFVILPKMASIKGF